MSSETVSWKRAFGYLSVLEEFEWVMYWWTLVVHIEDREAWMA